MIIHGGFDMEARYYGTRAVEAVYYGARLVWEAVSSCFGSGLWINSRPWSDTDAWKNTTGK